MNFYKENITVFDVLFATYGFTPCPKTSNNIYNWNDCKTLNYALQHPKWGFHYCDSKGWERVTIMIIITL